VGAVALLVFLPSAASAQSPTGYVSVFVDHLPNVNRTAELRTRLFVEHAVAPSRRVAFELSGFVETLVADRGAGRVRDAIVRPQDVYVDVVFDRWDLRAGFTRVVWGRLDELQPGDVVNPLDVSRFFFEGRGEARLPVALIRARAFLRGEAAIEAVYVPAFRSGRFDELDEPTSPFNPRSGFAIHRREPDVSWRRPQGGVRLGATTRRVDWALSAYRGVEPFGLLERSPGPGGPFATETFPRFTMIAGDFESVRGPWGIRGEVAAVLTDHFQVGPSVAAGRSLDAGAAIDRKAGDYRLSAGALVHRETPRGPSAPAVSRTDVSVLGSAERSFRRERYTVRSFGAVNVSEGSAFVRGIAAVRPRDRVAIEGSVGWFIGEASDAIGRFAARDFLYARLKVYF
jgi:hypothetical protein